MYLFKTFDAYHQNALQKGYKKSLLPPMIYQSVHVNYNSWFLCLQGTTKGSIFF